MSQKGELVSSTFCHRHNGVCAVDSFIETVAIGGAGNARICEGFLAGQHTLSLEGMIFRDLCN